MIEKLKKIEYRSITCDFWSNRSSKSFLAMAGHYISESFELNSTVIDFSHFEQRHFSENITDVIHTKLDRLNVLDCVTAVTCDGASNMKRACELLSTVDRLWCLRHRLHLIVTNALGFWLKDPAQNANEDMDDDPETDSSLANSTVDSMEISEEQESGMNINHDDEEAGMVSFSHCTST